MALHNQVTKHYIHLDIWGTASIISSSWTEIFRKTCLAGLYLQSIGLKCLEKDQQSLLNQKCFKMARTQLNGLETLKTILEEHWKSTFQNLYWRYKVMVSYSSSSNDSMKNWDNIQGHFLKTSNQGMLSCLSWTEHSTICMEIHTHEHECCLSTNTFSHFHQLHYDAFFNQSYFNFEIINHINGKNNKNR